MPLNEYFLQWQQINRPPENWQWREQSHQGMLYAVTWINQHATNILDVGSGIGRDYPRFTIPYQALDITPKFVATAHQHNVPILRASATALPFPNQAFDAVYCRNLLLHLPPGMWRQVLAEMVRVARRWVVTVEPEWEWQEDLRVREMLDEDPDNILMFYSNVYSRVDMIKFAHEQGVTYEFTCGYDDSRSAFLKKYVHWQVTIYTKPS